MAKKVFKTDLSVKGIEELKKQLLQYRDEELPRKCRQLTQALADIGVNVAKAKINESPLGHHITLQSTMSESEAGCKAMIIATGDIKKSEGYAPFNLLLAVEFGAGIAFNPTPNPIAGDFGYGVGTFPGQVHAFEKEGWYYWDEEAQEWKHTRGVKATMPMYSAAMEIQNKVNEAVKAVFG